MFYDLASTTWDADELDAIRRVCESDRYTMGEQVRQFEAAFAARFGMKHAVMVNSGSSADLVAVAALFYKRERPLQRGDEAIVPAISWATTYHPLQQYGLKLRFVDVDLNTLNMDAAQLESGADAADAPGGCRQRPRESGAARRDPAILRRARPLPASKTTASRWALPRQQRPATGTVRETSTPSAPFYSHHIRRWRGDCW
jgi:hypothetical protein